MFRIPELFKDNNHYGDYMPTIGDPFVEAISWLFSNKTNDGQYNEKYNLRSEVSTPDFMSCVYIFITAVETEHAELTINNYLSSMIGAVYYNLRDGDLVHVKEEGKNWIKFYRVSFEFKEAILWATYIYWRILYEADPNAAKLQRATNLLYNALRIETGLTDEAFKDHFLMEQVAPTIEKFGDAFKAQQRKRIQKGDECFKSVDSKSLDDYLDDPVYGKCYKGIRSVVGNLGFSTGKEYTEDDYLEVYIEGEKLVEEALHAKHPEIIISRIQTRINNKYRKPESEKNKYPYGVITPKRLFGVLVEMVFLVAICDKMQNKNENVIDALRDFRTVIEHHDTSYLYKENPMWKLIVERIPLEGEKTISQKEEKICDNSFQQEIAKLKEENELLKEELDACSKDAPDCSLPQKVSLEILYQMMEQCGVNFNENGNKRQAAILAAYLINGAERSCRNYATERNLNTNYQDKEILKVNTAIRKLGLNIDFDKRKK